MYEKKPLAVLLSVLGAFHSTADQLLNGHTFRIVNKNPSVKYYNLDFASPQERADYENALCEQVEAEGAVLLKNDGDTLPLQAGAKVTCLSRSSADIVYGGTGSGQMDASTAPTLKDALEDVGFAVNPTMWNFYTEGPGKDYSRSSGNLFTGEATHAIGEVPFSLYTEEALDSVLEYGDAAIVVLSRIGGESSDLPRNACADALDGNYLQLNEDERALLAQLKEYRDAGKVKRVIVLLNSANAIQLDFLDDVRYAVDACLWIGDVGQTGINAVADILAGIVTPSGRLVDTFCYDNFSSPAAVNFGDYTYTNASEAGLYEKNEHYVVYQEGIYIGYRYYETRYEDMVMETGNTVGYDYHADVAYPFGYGMSYTTFSYSDFTTGYNADDDTFEIGVTVTNTGNSYSGKETVQIYSQSPYTDYDKENGVEKASAALCGFAKTDILAPGQSQTLTITVNKRDLASYDSNNARTYILDAGTYFLL